MAKWITMNEVDAGDRRTKVWHIAPIDNIDNQASILGVIKWYSPWRRYAFYPLTGTLYEQDCLREIAEFIEEHTRLRKLEVELEKEYRKGHRMVRSG